MKLRFPTLVLISLIVGACFRFSKPNFDAKAEEEAIRAVLKSEQIAWNNGDIDSFMEGYWKSDSLQFMSSRGINHGWQDTREGYKTGYPDRAAMGTLSFVILQATPLSSVNFLVMGRYHLTRASGNLDGVFTLIFKKINGTWVAIYDHTC